MAIEQAEAVAISDDLLNTALGMPMFEDIATPVGARPPATAYTPLPGTQLGVSGFAVTQRRRLQRPAHDGTRAARRGHVVEPVGGEGRGRPHVRVAARSG